MLDLFKKLSAISEGIQVTANTHMKQSLAVRYHGGAKAGTVEQHGSPRAMPSVPFCVQLQNSNWTEIWAH